MELKINRNIIESIIDGVEFKLGTDDEKAQTVRDFNTWIKNNGREHIHLMTQPNLITNKTNMVVLVNRDQTLPISEDIFFNSEDYSFFKDLSRRLKEFQLVQLSFKFSNEDEKKTNFIQKLCSEYFKICRGKNYAPTIQRPWRNEP